MNTITLLQSYLGPFMVLVNVAAAAFMSALPAGTVLPWYIVPSVAVLNALAHAVPSPSSTPPADGAPKA